MVPMNSHIPGGLRPGKKIVINAMIPENAKDFKIDLLASEGIALHINPRFKDKVVVRNTFYNGAWGSEERSGSFPFKKKLSFEMVINVEHDKYMVAVNGQLLFEFRHRIAYQEVTGLQIHGDLTLTNVAFSGNDLGMGAPGGANHFGLPGFSKPGFAKP